MSWHFANKVVEVAGVEIEWYVSNNLRLTTYRGEIEGRVFWEANQDEQKRMK